MQNLVLLQTVRFWEKVAPRGTKLVLPTAPRQPVTLYCGRVMTSWSVVICHVMDINTVMCHNVMMSWIQILSCVMMS